MCCLFLSVLKHSCRAPQYEYHLFALNLPLLLPWIDQQLLIVERKLVCMVEVFQNLDGQALNLNFNIFSVLGHLTVEAEMMCYFFLREANPRICRMLKFVIILRQDIFFIIIHKCKIKHWNIVARLVSFNKSKQQNLKRESLSQSSHLHFYQKNSNCRQN